MCVCVGVCVCARARACVCSRVCARASVLCVWVGRQKIIARVFVRVRVCVRAHNRNPPGRSVGQGSRLYGHLKYQAAITMAREAAAPSMSCQRQTLPLDPQRLPGLSDADSLKRCLCMRNKSGVGAVRVSMVYVLGCRSFDVTFPKCRSGRHYRRLHSFNPYTTAPTASL